VRFIALALAALAVAPAASAGLPNPCTLLTNAQVAKVLGSKVVEATPTGNGRYGMCTWKGANMARPDAMPAQRSLIVQVSTTTEAAFKKVAEQTPGAVRIAGIGETAYSTHGALKSVNAFRHGYALMVVAGLTVDPLATAKAAAKLAVAKL